MTRSPNAHQRRHVLNVMSAVKRGVSNLQGLWTTTGTVYVPDPDGSSKMGTYRARQMHEYPEADPETWKVTIESLNDMIAGLSILRNQAVDHYKATASSTGQPIKASVVYPPTPPAYVLPSLLTESPDR